VISAGMDAGTCRKTLNLVTRELGQMTETAPSPGEVAERGILLSARLTWGRRARIIK